MAEKAAGEEWNEKLRKAGNEFGAATGRPRRVGPFDAVASRYGLQCQNAGDIALTKLDVLSCFEKIPVIMGYRVNGKLITDFPTNILLDDAMPEVEMLDGWNCDISSCKNWNDLPKNAKKYIERIEELIGHSIYLVSTGAKRDEYLLKE